MRMISVRLNQLFALSVMIAAANGLAQADEPLRVYTYGAPGAKVYVTPQSMISRDAISSSDVGPRAFDPRYYKGKAPLQIDLNPGLYMISVMPQTDYSMNDGMMKAREYVWDGYDYHALVDQNNNRWRYAHCYLIEKKADTPAEVLAVFTDQIPDAEAVAYDLGKKPTHFTGAEELAEEQLDAAGVPSPFRADTIKALQSGMKMLMRMGLNRWIAVADGPEHIRVLAGRGSGAWAGHRLSICSGEKSMF